jgi:hypothetical protein
MSLFLSAAYTEGLFLLLSVAAFLCARREQWAAAAVLGALASATRVTGLLLAIPLLIMCLQSDSVRSRPRALLWVAAVPLGLLLFCLALTLAGGQPAAPLTAAGRFWGRAFVLPTTAIHDAVAAAGADFRLLSSGTAVSNYDLSIVPQLGALVACGLALRETFRRLPPAYGAYAAAGLLVALCSETRGVGLVSFSRYASVLFPLFMAAGAWAAERARPRLWALVGASALLLIGFTVQFAAWQWVA